MAAKVEVHGLRQLRRELRKLGDDLGDLKDANAAVSRIVAAEAARRAPKRSGRLAAGVRGSRAVSRAVVRAGGAAVPYAGPIHWGWPAHNIDAQPFAADAATATEHVWLPVYETAVHRAADKVGRGPY